MAFEKALVGDIAYSVADTVVRQSEVGIDLGNSFLAEVDHHS